MAERLHLGIERRADAADLALRERGDAERLDQILHAAGRDTQHVRLLDHREEGPLGAPTGLEEAREVAAVADAGDGQIDRAGPRVPAPLAIPVAVGQAALRVALSMRHPGQLGHLGLHDRLGEDAEPSRRKSTSPSPIALRSISSTAILSSAIAASLRVVGFYSNDARMTRWPLSFTATLAVTPCVSIGLRGSRLCEGSSKPGPGDSLTPCPACWVVTCAS